MNHVSVAKKLKIQRKRKGLREKEKERESMLECRVMTHGCSALSLTNPPPAVYHISFVAITFCTEYVLYAV